MLAINAGFSEEQIDNFTYIFYKDCLLEISIKLNYDGIKSIVANPYVSDSMEIVNDANPLNYKESTKTKSTKPKATMGLLNALGFFNNKK